MLLYLFFKYRKNKYSVYIENLRMPKCWLDSWRNIYLTLLKTENERTSCCKLPLDSRWLNFFLTNLAVVKQLLLDRQSPGGAPFLFCFLLTVINDHECGWLERWHEIDGEITHDVTDTCCPLQLLCFAFCRNHNNPTVVSCSRLCEEWGGGVEGWGFWQLCSCSWR